MWEFGEEFVKKWFSQLALRLTRDCWPAKQTWEAHAGIWRVLDRLDFASDSWPAKLIACCFLEYDISHYLPTLYKPSLSAKCKKEYFLKKFLREKPKPNTWELKIVFTHNPLHHFSKFFIYSHLSIYTSLRGSYPKYLPHSPWVLREVLVPLGSIGRSHWVVDAIGQNCETQITSEDKTPRSPLVAGAWRAQVHWVD